MGGEPNGKGADFSNKKTIEAGTAPEKDRCVRGGPDMKNECEVNGMKRWNDECLQNEKKKKKKSCLIRC